jgi:hypothetical protein
LTTTYHDHGPATKPRIRKEAGNRQPTLGARTFDHPWPYTILVWHIVSTVSLLRSRITVLPSSRHHPINDLAVQSSLSTLRQTHTAKPPQFFTTILNKMADVEMKPEDGKYLLHFPLRLTTSDLIGICRLAEAWTRIQRGYEPIFDELLTPIVQRLTSALFLFAPFRSFPLRINLCAFHVPTIPPLYTT